MVKFEVYDYKFILHWLIVPIIIIITILAIINSNYYHGTNGFIINLITDLIAILITTIFVSSVLNENQKRIWKETEIKLKYRILFILNYYTAIFYDLLSYPPFELDKQIKLKDQDLIQEAIIEYAKKFLLDFDYLPKISINWELFFEGSSIPNGKDEGVKEIQDLIEKLFMMFHDDISPEIFSKLLDLDNIIFNSIRAYETLPEFFKDNSISPNAFFWKNSTMDQLKNGLVTIFEINNIVNQNKTSSFRKICLHLKRFISSYKKQLR